MNRQFLVGPNGTLQKNSTLKSSLHKACEFKYALKKKVRYQIPVSGLLPEELGKKKKKGKETHPHHTTSTALTGLFLWSGEDPLPISEILSRLFFFFWPFSHPSKSEARETKGTDLLICL